MGYVERTEAFNYSCTQMMPRLMESAERMINENGIAGFSPKGIVGLFLQSVESNLAAVPDSVLESPEKMGPYLLDSFESYDWLQTPRTETRGSSILSPEDLQDSWYGIDTSELDEPVTAAEDDFVCPGVHLGYRDMQMGPDGDYIETLPFGETDIPLDLHAIQRRAEERRI